MSNQHKSIKLAIVDIDNIMQLISQKKPAGGIVEINVYDDEDYILLRDKDCFTIGRVQKTINSNEEQW